MATIEEKQMAKLAEKLGEDRVAEIKDAVDNSLDCAIDNDYISHSSSLREVRENGYEILGWVNLEDEDGNKQEFEDLSDDEQNYALLYLYSKF